MSIVVYVLTDTHHVHACMGLWHVFTQTHMHAHTHMHSTKKEYLSSFNKNKQNLKSRDLWEMSRVTTNIYGNSRISNLT